jgi:hypothetical protein
MSDLVERVARALSVADGMHPEAVSNDEDQVPAWTLYVDDARAAIEATNYATLETALRTIQSAVPKYLKKEMTAEEFALVVIGEADSGKVNKALRGEKR